MRANYRSCNLVCKKNACVRAIVSERFEAIPRTCHNAFEHLHLGRYRPTHSQKRRVSCTQASRHVLSIVRALRSGVRTTAQGQRFATTAATYCQHITSAGTSVHQHRIDNVLAQQLQGKYETTLDKLISTDKILTLPTLQLQFSSAAGRVALLHFRAQVSELGICDESSMYMCSNILDRAQRR
jgi:hypothetical protein